MAEGAGPGGHRGRHPTVIIVEPSPIAQVGWRVAFSPRSGWMTHPVLVASCADIPAQGAARPPAAPRQVVVLDVGYDCIAGETHARDCVGVLAASGRAVLVRSGRSDLHLARVALSVGARGVVHRAALPGDVREAVQRLAHGGEWADPVLRLTPAQARLGVPVLARSEIQALVLYGGGMTLESVARKMNLRSGTVRTYLDRARAKYGACGRPIQSRADYTLRSVEDGYLGLG